jgi:mevalonate pyrophosphate decarboxylase
MDVRIKLKINVDACGLGSSGSGYKSAAGCCNHGNDLAVTMKAWNLFTS